MGRIPLLVAVSAVTVLGIVRQTQSGAATGPVDLSASVTPGQIQFPGTTDLTYSLRLDSSAQPQTVSVKVDQGSFGPPPSIGSPAELIAGSQRLTGAGRLLQFSVLPAFIPPLGAYVCRHGYTPTEVRAQVQLPAQSTTTLSLGYRTGAEAPWPETDFRLTYTVSGFQPQSPDSVLVSPSPATSGVRGVHITLSTRPRSDEAYGALAPTVRSGHAVTLMGATSPAVPRAQLLLAVARSRANPKARREIFINPPKFGPFKIVRASTSDSGQFRMHWRPMKSGIYDLLIRYAGQTGSLAPSSSCDHFIYVQ
jgi:hypothetical protein